MLFSVLVLRRISLYMQCGDNSLFSVGWPSGLVRLLKWRTSPVVPWWPAINVFANRKTSKPIAREAQVADDRSLCQRAASGGGLQRKENMLMLNLWIQRMGCAATNGLPMQLLWSQNSLVLGLLYDPFMVLPSFWPPAPDRNASSGSFCLVYSGTIFRSRYIRAILSGFRYDLP